MSNNVPVKLKKKRMSRRVVLSFVSSSGILHSLGGLVQIHIFTFLSAIYHAKTICALVKNLPSFSFRLCQSNVSPMKINHSVCFVFTTVQLQASTYFTLIPRVTLYDDNTGNSTPACSTETITHEIPSECDNLVTILPRSGLLAGLTSLPVLVTMKPPLAGSYHIQLFYELWSDNDVNRQTTIPTQTLDSAMTSVVCKTSVIILINKLLLLVLNF